MTIIGAILGTDARPEKGTDGFTPSWLSTLLAVQSKSGYKAVDWGKKYSGGKKVLVVCTEERYMAMENGKKFSTGNHPVETCVPIMHLKAAGFDFDIATPSGKPACIEMWAMPLKDQAFMDFYEKDAKPKFDKPLSLANVVANKPKLDRDYISLFLPGGHGAMLGLPEDPSLEKAILHMAESGRFVISVCHGPAALLAVKTDPHPFKDHKIAAFPDSVDKQTPMIGYIPGKMPWYFGEKLTQAGMSIVNKGADATVHADRKLLTGASPKACQALGVMCTEKLLEAYA